MSIFDGMGPLHKGFLNLLQYTGRGTDNISFYDTRLQRGTKRDGDRNLFPHWLVWSRAVPGTRKCIEQGRLLLVGVALGSGPAEAAELSV